MTGITTATKFRTCKQFVGRQDALHSRTIGQYSFTPLYKWQICQNAGGIVHACFIRPVSDSPATITRITAEQRMRIPHLRSKRSVQNSVDFLFGDGLSLNTATTDYKSLGLSLTRLASLL